MRQEISVLMDGEMFEDEAHVLLDKLKRLPETDRDWAAYHLIGDALRQPDHINRDFMAAFHERLQAEPTILAPRRRQQQRIKQLPAFIFRKHIHNISNGFIFRLKTQRVFKML